MSTIEERLESSSASGLIAPDILLPSQIDHSRPVSGYCALATAILHDTVKLAERYAQARAKGPIPTRLYKQVLIDRAWVNSTAIEPFSFTAVVELMGGEPEFWRRLLNDIYEGRWVLVGKVARMSHSAGGHRDAIRPARQRRYK